MGAVPYLPRSWFDGAGVTERAYLSNIWFDNFDEGSGTPPIAVPRNYFHLIGASNATDFDGIAQSNYDYCFVMVQNIEDAWSNMTSRKNRMNDVTNHELGHQFDVNADDCERHDDRAAWCGGEISSDCDSQLCQMNESRNPTSSIHRFCTFCLFKGAATEGSLSCDGYNISWTIGKGAIRREEDPK